jgi:hypothetical protein
VWGQESAEAICKTLEGEAICRALKTKANAEAIGKAYNQSEAEANVEALWKALNGEANAECMRKALIVGAICNALGPTGSVINHCMSAEACRRMIHRKWFSEDSAEQGGRHSPSDCGFIVKDLSHVDQERSHTIIVDDNPEVRLPFRYSSEVFASRRAL